MIAIFSRSLTALARTWRRRLMVAAAVPSAMLGAACWWLTEPITAPRRAVAHVIRPLAITPSTPTPPQAPSPVAWPAGRLEGEPAKRVLLDVLRVARKRLDGVEGYTATFLRQERIGGKLGPAQTLRMKARPRPFAIYLKVVAPKPGKEVVFVKGKHGDKMIAHNGDWKDRLIPRIKLDPRGVVALAENRHPITEAGLLNLTDKLIGFRTMDLSDPEAVTILDRTIDADGQDWLRSVHTHPHRRPERPFARVEVLYDPQTFLPMRISSYDWPEVGCEAADLRLAERYRYDDLDLDARLTELDFDPANPSYAFSRY